MGFKQFNNVVLEKPYRIDDLVLIGYPPERGVRDLKTVIGKNARIRSGTVIYAGTIIGRNFETGHNVVVREENVIGDNVRIWSNSVIDYGCRIGNNVKIHCNCYLAQFTTIEDDAFLGPCVTILNDPHPGCKYSKECMRGPTIKRGAQIGGNVTILPFVEIGEYSVIGAGSVITRDIPPRTAVYNPLQKAMKPIEEVSCPRREGFYPYRSHTQP